MTNPFFDFDPDTQIFFNDQINPDTGITGNFGGGIATPVPTPTVTQTIFVPTPTVSEEVCRPAGTFLGCSGTGNIGIFSLGEQPDGGCLTEERATSVCATVTPTPTPSIVTSGRICQGDAECPNGTFCDFSNPTFNEDLTNQFGVCAPITTTCPQQGTFLGCDPSGLGIFAGGESPPGQPCNTFTAPTTRCTGTCPPIGTFLRCTGLNSVLGGIGEFSGGIQNGQCSSYTAVTDECTPPPDCPVAGTFIQCTGEYDAGGNQFAEYSNGIINGVCVRYTGVATPDVCPPRINCEPPGTFLRCIPGSTMAEFSAGIVDGFCTKYEQSFERCVDCAPKDTFLRCANASGDGQAIFSNGKISDECAEYVGFDSRCRAVTTVCETVTETTACTSLSSNYVSGTASRLTEKIVNGQRVPAGCLVATGVTGVWDETQCVRKQCPPADTFLRCEDLTGTGTSNNVYSTGQLVNGQCQERRELQNRQCIEIPPCTSPSGPFEQRISVSCTSISTDFTSGVAFKTQERSFNSDAPGPGECPYTGWQDVGQVDVSQCVRSRPNPTVTPTPPQIFWRSCITGQLNSGNAPADHREVPYSAGGTCWEPVSDITFAPSLQDALKFIYTRGSGKYPTPVSVEVSNGSYGLSYNVRLTTNPDVTITPSSFILAPRSSQKFTVGVTPQLLEKLGDGTSVLNLQVEINQQ